MSASAASTPDGRPPKRDPAPRLISGALDPTLKGHRETPFNASAMSSSLWPMRREIAGQAVIPASSARWRVVMGNMSDRKHFFFFFF